MGLSPGAWFFCGVSVGASQFPLVFRIACDHAYGQMLPGVGFNLAVVEQWPAGGRRRSEVVHTLGVLAHDGVVASPSDPLFLLGAD